MTQGLLLLTEHQASFSLPVPDLLVKDVFFDDLSANSPDHITDPAVRAVQLLSNNSVETKYSQKYCSFKEGIFTGLCRMSPLVRCSKDALVSVRSSVDWWFTAIVLNVQHEFYLFYASDTGRTVCWEVVHLC